LWLGEPRRGLRAFGLVLIAAMIVSLSACFAFLDRTAYGFTRAEGWLCLLCLATCVLAIGSTLAFALVRREGGLWVRWLGLLALVGADGGTRLRADGPRRPGATHALVRLGPRPPADRLRRGRRRCAAAEADLRHPRPATRRGPDGAAAGGPADGASAPGSGSVD